jgi:hypothetical protein
MNENRNSEEQEKLDMPKWLTKIMTIVGGITLLMGISFIIMHIAKDKFPEPETLKVEFLLGFGALILLISYLPWSRIKFGGFEVESLIQEQSEDYSLEIEKLNLKLEEYEKIISDLKEGKETILTEFNPDKSNEKKNLNKTILYDFLSKWSTYGFTVSRVHKWGGDRKTFGRLKEMENSEIRLLADELVRDGKVKKRISSNNNILYQKK